MQLSQKIYKLEWLVGVELNVHNRESVLKRLMFWEGTDEEKTAEVRDLVSDILLDLGLDQYVYYHNDDNGPTKYEKQEDYVKCNRK